LRQLVLAHERHPRKETGGATPLVAALREHHGDCALWSIHGGAVADIEAGMGASLAGRNDRPAAPRRVD
jgi:hypothetical protein